MAAEPFEALAISDITSRNNPGFFFRYDVVELATVLKPQLLTFLLEQGFDRVVFLDPDVLVISALDSVLEQLDDSNVLLTPHLDSDYPDDGAYPDTEAILRHGIYNLGFIAVKASAETTRMLTWWDGKIRDCCFRDYSELHFVDQRVMDLAPVLFKDVSVLRSPGLNVAWWNIHSRVITRDASRWFSNGAPLMFFHFSAFNAHTPHTLSTKCTRTIVQEGLWELCENYAGQLFAEGYTTSNVWPYSYDMFSDGVTIHYKTRRHYRKSAFLQLTEPDPFKSGILKLVNGWHGLGLCRFSDAIAGTRKRVRILFGRCWHSVFAAFRGPLSTAN